RGVWPLNAAGGFDRLVRHPRVVAEASRRDALPLLEGVGRARPSAEELVAASEGRGEIEEDVEIRTRLTRRVDCAIHLADTPFRVRVRPFLLAPDGCGEHEIGERAGRRRVKP